MRDTRAPEVPEHIAARISFKMSGKSQSSVQEGTHDTPARRSTNKKRKFQGNRHAGAVDRVHQYDMTKFKHDYLPLDLQIQEVLEPIYSDLSRPELLNRCKDSSTQNNNESYNGLLWHFAPKHLHSGLKTIELANFFAVAIFNEEVVLFPLLLRRVPLNDRLELMCVSHERLLQNGACVAANVLYEHLYTRTDVLEIAFDFAHQRVIARRRNTANRDNAEANGADDESLRPRLDARNLYREVLRSCDVLELANFLHWRYDGTCYLDPANDTLTFPCNFDAFTKYLAAKCIALVNERLRRDIDESRNPARDGPMDSPQPSHLNARDRRSKRTAPVDNIAKRIEVAHWAASRTLVGNGNKNASHDCGQITMVCGQTLDKFVRYMDTHTSHHIVLNLYLNRFERNTPAVLRTLTINYDDCNSLQRYRCNEVLDRQLNRFVRHAIEHANDYFALRNIHSYDTNSLATGIATYVASAPEGRYVPNDIAYSMSVAIVTLHIFARDDTNVLLFFLRYATTIRFPGQFLKTVLLLQGTSDSGKSEFVSEVLRPIFSSVLSGTLSNATLRQGIKDEVNTDLMSMMRSHVCQADEPERMNAELFKNLISTTMMKSRYFHQQQTQYLRNLTKIVLTVNDAIPLRSDAGVITRLKFCLRMVHRFKALHSRQHDTAVDFVKKNATPSVSYQFATRCFAKGVNFPEFRTGLFFAMEHYGTDTCMHNNSTYAL
ncbi:hypothetical protein EAI_05533 [Harpegnathos saltator]|uniref:Uncharacterized protein n=1 Tax=Harpegnathos saltator TaxID=610380 RepID=E2BK56_HARSA|nr:hypothetical protein EAI_05533 [Harpegnathos saltator]